MNHGYAVLEKKLNELLSALSGLFTESEVAEVRHFLDVGEYGLAFETLCQIATEGEKKMPEKLHPLIRGLAE